MNAGDSPRTIRQKMHPFSPPRSSSASASASQLEVAAQVDPHGRGGGGLWEVEAGPGRCRWDERSERGRCAIEEIGGGYRAPADCRRMQCVFLSLWFTHSRIVWRSPEWLTKIPPRVFVWKGSKRCLFGREGREREKGSEREHLFKLVF